MTSNLLFPGLSPLWYPPFHLNRSFRRNSNSFHFSSFPNFWHFFDKRRRASYSKTDVCYTIKSLWPSAAGPLFLNKVIFPLMEKYFLTDRTERPFSRGEREFPFPTIPGTTSLQFPFPKIGNDFFIPIPVPKSWECYFSFPFPKFGMQFSIPVPVTGNGLSKSEIRTGIKFKRWENEGF